MVGWRRPGLQMWQVNGVGGRVALSEQRSALQFIRCKAFGCCVCFVFIEEVKPPASFTSSSVFCHLTGVGRRRWVGGAHGGSAGKVHGEERIRSKWVNRLVLCNSFVCQ